MAMALKDVFNKATDGVEAEMKNKGGVDTERRKKSGSSDGDDGAPDEPEVYIPVNIRELPSTPPPEEEKDSETSLSG